MEIESSGLQSARMQRLQSDLIDIGPDALRRFWDEVQRQGAPIIEPGMDGDTLVTFLWREVRAARDAVAARDAAATQNVAVIQDWGADGIREHHMNRLPGSDVWYLTRRMRSDTRTTYQLSPSLSTDPSLPAPYQPDPLNPKIFLQSLSETGSDIPFSLLELPDAPALPWRQTGAAAAGTVQLHQPFADQRRLWVYLPPGGGSKPLPVLVALDGRIYKDHLKLPEILDFLIGTGKIPPVAALMIDNADRSELLCRPEFAGMAAHQILPWFRGTAPVATDPRHTVIMGTSYGGLAAAFLAHQHPAVFVRVFSQTGWFRWRPDGDLEHHWLARQLASAPVLPLRFWLQVGNLETAQMADGGPTQLAANQLFRDTL
jgi:enterochelin esterase family protein